MCDSAAEQNTAAGGNDEPRQVGCGTPTKVAAGFRLTADYVGVFFSVMTAFLYNDVLFFFVAYGTLLHPVATRSRVVLGLTFCVLRHEQGNWGL